MFKETGLHSMRTRLDEDTFAGTASRAVHCGPAHEAESIAGLAPFAQTLANCGLELKKERTRTLQLNVGAVCNQRCAHCHHDAGPHRCELMDKETADEVLAYARRAAFDTAEITGGAPEFNPHIGYIIEKLAELTRKVSLRTNLTALLVKQSDEIIELCLRNKVTVVASFPSMNRYETNAQRGEEVFERSIEALKMLNKVGYGKEGTCLELILVVNPSGPHLNQDQQAVEQQFREILWKEWGVSFNNLYSLTNVPLGRFGASLKRNGAMGAYLLRLAAHFNPLAVAGLMCRTLVCVSWDGHLYDCDFNLAAGLALAGSRMHVSQMADLPESGTVIPTGTHCYACVAGAGFT